MSSWVLGPLGRHRAAVADRYGFRRSRRRCSARRCTSATSPLLRRTYNDVTCRRHWALDETECHHSAGGGFDRTEPSLWPGRTPTPGDHVSKLKPGVGSGADSCGQSLCPLFGCGAAATRAAEAQTRCCPSANRPRRLEGDTGAGGCGTGCAAAPRSRLLWPPRDPGGRKAQTHDSCQATVRGRPCEGEHRVAKRSGWVRPPVRGPRSGSPRESEPERPNSTERQHRTTLDARSQTIRTISSRYSASERGWSGFRLGAPNRCGTLQIATGNRVRSPAAANPDVTREWCFGDRSYQ